MLTVAIAVFNKHLLVCESVVLNSECLVSDVEFAMVPMSFFVSIWVTCIIFIS